MAIQLNPVFPLSWPTLLPIPLGIGGWVGARKALLRPNKKERAAVKTAALSKRCAYRGIGLGKRLAVGKFSGALTPVQSQCRRAQTVRVQDLVRDRNHALKNERATDF